MAESNDAYDPAKDPKWKAKSGDVGWRYGFWPDLTNRDVVQCILCSKLMHSRVRRLKQHLAGGFSDVAMCTKTTPTIIKEMKDYIQKNAKKSVPLDDDLDDDDDNEDDKVHETAGSNTLISSKTTAKRKKMSFIVPQSKPTKTIASMIRKSPEEVIEERHSKSPSQTTLENSTKSEEEKDRVKMHIANFFYECGIPFNAANSRSYEIMVESIGQFGPGLKPPTFHELWLPLLEKVKKETDNLREKHEKAWKQYGCTLMSYGWIDKRGRHLINFLVNSPEGTFFLKSVDVSSKVKDARMLVDLFEEQIDLIGRDIVVQVVTDNGANFKEHARLLYAMREKTMGRDIVKTGATRFATWFNSNLAKTVAGGISTRFWSSVEDCIRASQPLLVVLRIVDGDEKPSMVEICASIEYAKAKIKGAFEKKPRLSSKVLSIIEKRWESQMEVDLYSAALFLNPGRFFDIKEDDYAYSSRLRMKFNDVLERMVLDTSVVENISDQADQYENSRNSFGKQLSIRQRKTKNPLDWWGAFGGNTIELTMFAKRVVGLCCSSSGCERNWSTFEFIHTKKRNRLEHQRLNDLVYIQYNRKIATRFQKRREDGKNFDPLLLDDFQWDNEWLNGEVVDPGDVDRLAVDRALEASEGIDGRRNPSRKRYFYPNHLPERSHLSESALVKP
ncbi:hypothetical protein OROGR_023373 [Orobanche gracilis]